MRYLLNTWVIFKLIQRMPSPSVLTWINAQDEEHLFSSVITMGELRKGINLLAEGKNAVPWRLGWKMTWNGAFMKDGCLFLWKYQNVGVRFLRAPNCL